MNLAEPFIRRPIATSLVMLAILMFGIVAYRSLPVSDLPTVDFPVILVTATLPGANPDTMASAVATPLEKQFSTIAGVESMNSVSALGSCQIILQFNLNRNIDAAAQDVQTAIAQAQPQLPQNLPSPPTYRKVNPADQPVIYLALSSPMLPLSDVDEYAETLMAQRISMVQDVAQVQVYGAQKYAVRVQLDPRTLASRQIGIDEVVNAVDAANVNLPTGVLDGPKQSFTIQASGQLERAKAYRPVIVTYRNGSPVRLQELGDVIDSVENNKTVAWYNRTRGVVLAIQKQPGSNTIRVIDRVKELLPKFRSQLPPSVELNILYDRSVSIRESVTDVKFTLVLTIGLVVLVIFLFLRNLSATLIPSLALPFSIVGTFAIMYPLGFSVDNLSLMALTLAVGFLVDDAIVMLENIVRHMEMGKTAWQASLDGSREIGFTIISMTLSLAAVFLPVLFMGGVPGRLFREFSVTIGAAILVSGFVSLTLTPMLASMFLRPSKEAHHGKAYLVLERFFDGMLHLYDTTLQSVLRHRRAMMVTWVVSLVLMGWCFVKIPKGFLPSEDRGIVFMPTEAAEGISFSDMVEHQKAVRDVALADPDVESALSAAGGGPTSQGMNSGFMFIRLKPRDQRRSSVDQYIERLRPRLAAIPGIQAYPQNPPPIQISATFTKAQYQFTLQGPDTKELFDRTTRMVAKLQGLPELRDVTTDVQIKNPQVTVDINRDKASALGVTAAQVEDALYAAYATRQVSTILAPNNQYRVIVELKPEYQADPVGAVVVVRSFLKGATGAVGHRGEVDARLRSARDQPFRAVAGGDHLVQSPAGRLHRRRGGRGGSRGARNAARHHQQPVPGHCASVRVFDGGHGGVVDHDHSGHLHHSGNSVRKLHSSADDSVRVAVGGSRCSGDLDDFPCRSELVRHRGHHHVDRHREEERDHDDRFRPGRGAQGEQVSRRCHLPGLPGPVPPDHDDHDGRAGRHASHRAWPGRWRRSAPATRPGGCRRLAGFPVDHVVSYAGRVHVSGRIPEERGQLVAAARAQARCREMGDERDRSRHWPHAGLDVPEIAVALACAA